jgi:hypothetical protein
MYRLLALVLTAVTALPVQTLFAAGAVPASAATGQISGRAFDVAGKQLSHVTMRVRNVGSGLTFGEVAATTLSGVAGDFSFSGLRAGSYIVEVGNAQGQVIGTSRVIPLTPGQMVAGGIGIAAVAEAGAGQAGAGAGAASFFTSTLGIVVVAAVAAGVAVGVYEATKSNASPSR